MANIDERKLEAEKRLEKLDLHPNVLKEFKEGTLYYSERTPLGGILYWISNNPEWEELIKDVEKKYDLTFYHFTHEHTAFGELLSGLYVSQEDEEWEYDNEDLDNDEALAYVINLTHPDFSEFGTIGIKQEAGGLMRIY